MKRAAPVLVLALLVGTLAPAPTPAQVPAAAPGRSRDAGWIGISVDVQTLVSGFEGRTRAVVTEVGDDSPAARAGVKPGDLLVSINGHGLEDGFGAGMDALRAGDAVTVVVVRDGRRRDLTMIAAPRPLRAVVATPVWALPSVGSDSMVDAMFQAMDSLRLRLVQGGGALTGVITLPGPDASRVSEDRGGRLRLRTVDGEGVRVLDVVGTDSVFSIQLLPEVRPPFSFFVVPGDRTDSLQAAMDDVNRQIRILRSRRATRLRQLASAAGGVDVGDDPELRRIAAALDDVDRHADDLRGAMERAAAETTRDPGVYAALVGSAGAAVTQTSLRPLAPYLLGQNRAAGAEVVNLRPELAAYFQVEGGVLVVDVPDGTPAAMAGVQPGDVVTQVDGRAVRSIQEMRVGLSREGGGPVTLTLVRKGRRLEVLLPR
jgi:membrane-associated protease RseP (regulator of RpoE activity)